jgi:hypothetical protein
LGPGGAIRAKSLRYGVKYSAAGGESVQKRVTQRRKARKEEPRDTCLSGPRVSVGIGLLDVFDVVHVERRLLWIELQAKFIKDAE